MQEKTVSQKIARVFEIVDYILLVPAFLGLYAGTMLGAAGLGILAVFIIGVILLIGYFKHSRGRLSEGKIIALWIGTILFNGLFLLPSLYFLFADAPENSSGNQLFEILFSPYGWILVWWTIAIGGSIIALSSYKNVQKYR